MKKFGMILLISTLLVLFFAACIRQNVRQEVTFLEGYNFEEVWSASIMAVNDIDFTVDSMDKAAGFISAEAGPHVLQEAPPRLSIMIREMDGSISVDCKILQKDQFIDIFGHGKKTVRRFMVALNTNLNLASQRYVKR